jgi:hypothetical protein
VVPEDYFRVLKEKKEAEKKGPGKALNGGLGAGANSHSNLES